MRVYREDTILHQVINMCIQYRKEHNGKDPSVLELTRDEWEEVYAAATLENDYDECKRILKMKIVIIPVEKVDMYPWNDEEVMTAEKPIITNNLKAKKMIDAYRKNRSGNQEPYC